MAKDPAFLFYPGDWLGGTMLFSRSHKGAYMDLLMAQFNNGHMNINQIKIVLGSDYAEMWESVLKPKFQIDENGLYYSKKMDDEVSKRKKYTESRRKNLEGEPHIETHIAPHMENENENETKDKKEINVYSKQFDEFWNLYPKRNGRKVGKKNTLKLFKNIEEFDLLIIATKNYTESKIAKDNFSRDPERFLKNDFWQDWIGEIENESIDKSNELTRKATETYERVFGDKRNN